VEEAIPLREECGAVGAWVYERWLVGQDGEGRGLRPGKVIGRAVEISPRRGLEPDDVPAERGVRGVERYDVTL